MLVAYLLVVMPHPATGSDPVLERLAEIEIPVSAIRHAHDDNDPDPLARLCPSRLLRGETGQFSDHVFGLSVLLAQDVAPDILPVVAAQGVPWDREGETVDHVRAPMREVHPSVSGAGMRASSRSVR